MILGLFTALLQSGGIEKVNQQAAMVLDEIARTGGQNCALFSLNEPQGQHVLEVDGRNVYVRGFNRDKRRFALATLAAAPKASFAYIAHPNLAPLGLLLKLVRPRARYVVATYGTEVWDPLPFIPRMGLRKACAVSTISRFTADKLIENQRLGGDRITVIPCALSASWQKISKTVSFVKPPVPGRFLLTVGRLVASERQKGVDVVIRSLPEIVESFPDVHYVVIGDGDDRPRLERLARETGVADRVIFAGAVSDEQLAGYYAFCDVFVMPSRQEGFGIVFLEAMIFGRPVIGGNHGGTPEVIADKVNGYLVDHGDIPTLTDRVKQLLRDQALSRQMGVEGRRRVEQDFTFERLHRRMREFITNQACP